MRQYFQDVRRVADWYRTNMLMQSAPTVLRVPVQLIKSGVKDMALMTTAEKGPGGH